MRYKDTPRAPAFDLGSESDEALVARLSSPNIYFREAAQRLLAGRDTPGVRERLKSHVSDESAPRKARLHGLWALIGAGHLEPDFHARLLEYPDPAFRAWGVRAAGDFGIVEPAIRERVASLATDPAPDVQLQVAIAARKVAGQDPLPVLVAVLSACGEDRMIPAVAWPNLHPLLPSEGERFVRLVDGVNLGAAPGLAKLLPNVIDRLIGDPDADLGPVRAILGRLVDRDAGLAQECLAVVSDRLPQLSEARRDALRDRLRPVLDRLNAGESGSPLALGAQLLAARLGVGSVKGGAIRERFTAPESSPDIRLRALEALVAFGDPALPDALDRVLSQGPPGFLAR